MNDPQQAIDFSAITPELIRKRRGMKWTRDPGDIIGAWVADMDFPPPPAVKASIQRLLDENDLGYHFTEERNDVLVAYADFMESHHGFRPDVEMSFVLTEVVQGIYAAIETLTNPGDGVLVMVPVYYPFLNAIEASGRRQINYQLRRDDGWVVDEERLRAAVTPETAMVILCNPHNPTGRVLTRSELDIVARVAHDHDLVVVADEIHADLVYDDTHIPFASLGGDAAQRTVTLTAASKTFNIAGLRTAVGTFGSTMLRRRWERLEPRVLGSQSAPGLYGSIAAWTEGDAWLSAVLKQLRANRDHIETRLAAELPAVTFSPPEATYLAWLDVSALDLGEDPAQTILERTGVALSAGPPFGPGGEGHVRMNFATIGPIVDEMLDRIGVEFGR